MKVLVYGAGNIGSLYAAKLTNAGNDVAILATGERLSQIREHGIRLQDFVSGEKTTTRVEAVERLAPDDAYDFVLVILPRDNVSEVLPILAANRNTPSVMFF
jgi:2-dehydropantoate 2-reductase